MKCAEVIKFCRQIPGSEQRNLNHLGTAIGFFAQGVQFALFETGAPIQWQFSLPVSEDLYESLHSPPRILKADKGDGHWITIARVENFPDDELISLIKQAYQLTVKQSA